MSSKGFNPYITVADDVSPLYLLTLLENLKRKKLKAQNEIARSYRKSRDGRTLWVKVVLYAFKRYRVHLIIGKLHSKKRKVLN